MGLTNRFTDIFNRPAPSLWLYFFWLSACFFFMPRLAFPQTVISFPADSASQPDKERQMVQIDKIFVHGNKKTKEYVIRREVSLEEGEVVSLAELEDILKEDRQRIFNTRLFQKVETTAIPLSDNLYDVLIEVSERWYVVPVPIFNLVDRNFNDWWENQERDLSRVNLGAKFTHYNFRGRREKLSLVAQFGYTRSMLAQYYVPYIDKTRKNGMGISLQYATNNNIPLRTTEHKRIFIDDEKPLREVYGASLNFTRRASFYNTHTASLSFFSNYIADTVLALNPDYLMTGNNMLRYFSLSYNFRRDLRDVFSYPLRGFLINADVTKRGLGIFNDLNLFSVEATYNHHVPLNNKFFFSNSFTGRISAPKAQPYHLLTGMGYGGKYIRGYELYVIEGQHLLLNKTELKYELFKEDIALGGVMPLEQFRHLPFAVYPKLYLDAGYVFMPVSYPSNELLVNRPLWGGGAGLDVVSFYDFVFRMEYSFNSLGERGFFLHFTAGI